MAHPQNSPRGLWSKRALQIGGQAVTGNSTGVTFPGYVRVSNKSTGSMTANSTGLIVAGAIYPTGSSATGAKLTGNSTALIVAGGVKVSNKSTGQLTANSTALIAPGAFRVSNKSTGQISANSTAFIIAGPVRVNNKSTGQISANSTAILLPATGFQMAALTSLKITSNSTGIKIGARYISTNTTGNT